MSFLQKCSTTLFSILHGNLKNVYVSNPGLIFNVSVRNIMRNHFPRPHEGKRIKRHGWNKRMSTRAGQRIIMRNILKGKHVLSH